MKSRVYQLLHFFQTAPVWKKNSHYLLGSYVPVGEAITLAMETHHK